jgi:hypothetical protein
VFDALSRAIRTAMAAHPRRETSMRRLATVGVFATALAFMAGGASAAPLSGADVEALLKGKTFNTQDFGGTGTITWNADMTIAVNVKKDDGTMVEDTGTYRFDGAGYCSTWKVLRTEEKCFTLVKTGDTTYDIINPDGSVDSKLTAQ